ncbi:hypothetical protein H5410_051551 [Solanum commersonii]|uniref:Uncharacterized protein n=1 Tax=Solanum commersonii TaxID=4109 RepID=A0A9J5X0W0_SOLCO|nr:hypothetical protein H5410_051551 [Solanum commersonii]
MIHKLCRQPVKILLFQICYNHRIGGVIRGTNKISFSYIDGIPHIQWTASEVEQMNIKEDLQYAVVGKIAHGWPEYSLFSLATAIGKPLQLDQATINQSRPSCAKVRVLVDLAANLPKAVVVNVLDEATGELKPDKITIKYDYIPRYCLESNESGESSNNNDIATNVQGVIPNSDKQTVEKKEINKEKQQVDINDEKVKNDNIKTPEHQP